MRKEKGKEKGRSTSTGTGKGKGKSRGKRKVWVRVRGGREGRGLTGLHALATTATMAITYRKIQ